MSQHTLDSKNTFMMLFLPSFMNFSGDSLPFQNYMHALVRDKSYRRRHGHDEINLVYMRITMIIMIADQQAWMNTNTKTHRCLFPVQLRAERVHRAPQVMHPAPQSNRGFLTCS